METDSITILPSNILYIKNLNDKLKPDALKKQLYMMFSQYGRVTQIIASKGTKLRGQAWVGFQDSSSATNALRGKQGFSLFGKQLIIQFAKPRENTSIVGGSTREKRKREPDVAFASIPLTAGSTPNSVLFAQALPPEVSEQTLKVIFGQCTGFLEVRLAPGARGFAFIQFEDEVQSTMALKQLHGFQLSSTHALQLAYANV